MTEQLSLLQIEAALERLDMHVVSSSLCERTGRYGKLKWTWNVYIVKGRDIVASARRESRSDAIRAAFSEVQGEEA